MARKSPLLRTGFACLFVFIFDLASKGFAGAATGDGVFTYGHVTKVLESGLPNAGLALFLMVVASVFVAIALASHIFLPQRLLAWPIGLGLATGGFFANAYDRVRSGSVSDVFTLRPAALGFASSEMHFNFAHAAEIIAGLLLLFGLARGLAGDWNVERRRRILIERGYQIRYCWTLQGAITLGFVPMFLASLVAVSSFTTPAGFVLLLWGTAFLAYVAMTIVTWTVGIRLSNRTAGAIVRFSKTAVQRLNGHRPAAGERHFVLRENDEFRERLAHVMHAIDTYTTTIDRLTKKPASTTKRSS